MKFIIFGMAAGGVPLVMLVVLTIVQLATTERPVTAVDIAGLAAQLLIIVLLVCSMRILWKHTVARRSHDK